MPFHFLTASVVLWVPDQHVVEDRQKQKATLLFKYPVTKPLPDPSPNFLNPPPNADESFTFCLNGLTWSHLTIVSYNNIMLLAISLFL